MDRDDLEEGERVLVKHLRVVGKTAGGRRVMVNGAGLAKAVMVDRNCVEREETEKGNGDSATD